MPSTAVAEKPRTKTGVVSEWMETHFRHFNARETLDASKAYKKHIDDGGKMLVSIAGAMSTGEMGIILARMIREGKVHAISSTGANLEEDLFNLMAHDDYFVVPGYRDLTPEQELELRDKGFNRVTDTCIPETVMRELENQLIDEAFVIAAEKGERYFPYEYMYRLLDKGTLQKHFRAPAENSWVLAAWEKGIPIYSPGWEDSTIGNIFAARVMQGKIKSHTCVKSGTEQMERLVNWYRETTKDGTSVGFYQIGGGIAGDFAICAVPLIIQDLKEENAPLWGYFCQIGDSTTSYGSYSGAVPNEKITWYKIAPDTPKFMINSDAMIIAPLMFSYVLGD